MIELITLTKINFFNSFSYGLFWGVYEKYILSKIYFDLKQIYNYDVLCFGRDNNCKLFKTSLKNNPERKR